MADGSRRRGRHGGHSADPDPADNPRGRVLSWESYRTPRQFDGRTQDSERSVAGAVPGPADPRSPSNAPTDPGSAAPPWRRTVQAARRPGRDARDPRTPADLSGPRVPRSPLIAAGTGDRHQRVRTRGLVVLARALLASASATVILASGMTWAAYHDLTAGLLTSSALNALKPGEKGYVKPRLDGSVNLLLIGLDSRKDMNGNDLPTRFVEDELHAGSSGIGGYNTNVLIFMHIPADGGRVTAFSIARDDYVEEPGGDSSVGPIPDLGMHKIKEAYGRAKAIAEQRLRARGETDKAKIEAESREVGRESTIRAVQLLTGEHVDHFAEINLLGFYDIAQAVGPIEVCLNHPVNDPIEDGAGTGLQLPAGHSELNAAQALQFVRQRFHLLRGDFDRNRRQQAFLAAVVAKLRGEGVIGDLGRMQDLMNVVKKDVVIDDGWDVLDFAQRAQNLTGGNAVFNELPITGQPVLPGDGSVNTVDPERIRRIVMTEFGDGAPPAQPSTTEGTPVLHNAIVDVYNASGRQGQAAGAAGVLTAAGWTVSGVMNAPFQTQSTVYYGPGAEEEAGQVAAKLGLSASPAPSARASAQRVIVFLGTDYVPPDTSGGGPAAGGSVGTDGGGPGVGEDSAVDSGAPTSDSPAPDGPAPLLPSGDGPGSGGIAMSDGVTCVN